MATWNTGEGIFGSIDSLRLLPTIDQAIILSVVSPEGCEARDTSLLDVMTDFDRIELYVPNILIPSSSEGNDALVIQITEDIERIDFFSIYDRWGQQVMHIEQEVRKEPFVIWDGRYNGSDVASGVYVYIYQITTVEEGRKKVIGGDITIIK